MGVRARVRINRSKLGHEAPGWQGARRELARRQVTDEPPLKSTEWGQAPRSQPGCSGGENDRFIRTRALRAFAVVLLATTAFAKPTVERIDQVTIDFAAKTLTTRGAGAADLFAPTAAVARHRAERTAHQDALAKLRRTIATIKPSQLGLRRTPVLPSLDRAKVTRIDWGTDGSVLITFQLPFQALEEGQ